ncbi:MAG: hypothetical protein ABIY90_13015 [Puia sp.]
MLKVKMGSKGPFKIWKMRFGDYAVVSSHRGWTTGYTTSNLFKLRTESKSTDKFSFVLINKTNDSARVNAANHILIQELRSIELPLNFYLGEDELLSESRNFCGKTPKFYLKEDEEHSRFLFSHFVKE